MWWNGRFPSWMCSRQICSNCVMLSCQYGPQSLRNIFNTLLNLCHEELRQFWRQKGVQPGTSKVYLIKWPVSVDLTFLSLYLIILSLYLAFLGLYLIILSLYLAFLGLYLAILSIHLTFLSLYLVIESLYCASLSLYLVILSFYLQYIFNNKFLNM